MKKKKTLYSTLLLLLILEIFLIPSCMSKTGFGPAEIFTSNQRDTLVIGKATLLNGDDIAKYGIFSLINPYNNKDTWQVVASEIVHARVLCNTCGNEMQRWEAIEDYIYDDTLDGVCPQCGSLDLIFYEPMPRDEYEFLYLEGAQNFHLEKLNGHTYRTIEMISPGGACSVNLLYDAASSYLTENYKTHWEFHLRGSTQSQKDSGDFMTGGIDLRILVSFKFPLFIDVLSNIEKGEQFTVKIVYGDAARTWEEKPESANVNFNGVSKPIGHDGTVSFIFPETRGDYEYKIEASSHFYYLPVTRMLKTGDYITNEDEPFYSNIYVISGIVIVIIALIGYLLWYFLW